MGNGEKNNGYRFETLQVHAGHEVDPTLSRAVPIYQTTAYVFNDAEHAANLFALREPGNIYTRLMNPTTDVLEKRVAALNGGIGALAVASGHSAQVIALTNIMKAGENFVSSKHLYGGSYNQFSNAFRNLGIECRMTDTLDAADYEALIDDKTKALYVESISNTNFSVPDFEALADVAHRHGIPLIVDNTFGAGSYICRPFDFGADIIVESATKWLGGHANSMGGIITDAGRFDWGNGKFPLLSEPSDSYHGLKMWETFGNAAYITKCRVEGLRDLGPAISPMNSWLILQGIETLSLRMDRECDSSMKLARWFETHPMVESVCYPGLESHPTHENAKKYLRNGFGGVLSVVVKGTRKEASDFVKTLKLVSHVSNVGDTRTLIVQPAATTHSQLDAGALKAAGIEETMLRISVGLEHLDDLKADFEQAFAAMK